MSNKNIDWNETNNTITINIPLSYRIDKSKIDYVITDSYIKLNIPEMKIFNFIDLNKEININGSKILLEENKVIFFLEKKEEGLWKKLISELKKNELKERRKLADERYNKIINEQRELAKTQKQKFERFAVDQSIKVDNEFREELRNRKDAEKKQAENELYKFVDKIDNKNNNDEDDVNLNNNKFEEEKNSNIPKNINQLAELIKNEEKNNLTNNNNNNIDKKQISENEEEIDTSSHKNNSNKIKNNINNEIFNSNQIPSIPKEDKIVIESPMVSENNFQKTLQKLIETKNENKNNIKEEKKDDSNNNNNIKIRQKETVTVNLTKKLIPTFAARESLAKEPPYPKSKKYVPEKNYLGQEIDDRNPIWTKERADNFYKNKDFKSAINAYNKALELDPSFHKCLLNRGTAYMRLGEFDKALYDFNKTLELIDSLDEKEKVDVFYDKINVRALTKIYAVYALKQEYQKSLDIINEKLLLKEHAFPYIIPNEMWKKIEDDKILIMNRMENEKLKKEGDKFLSEKEYIKAEEIYNKILSNEPSNERVLSNISLIYLQQEKYEQVIECCSKILKIFSTFKEKINLKNTNNLFEIKILLRRAKCYEILGNMQQAEKDVERIEKLEITNPQVLKDIKLIKDKLKIHVVNTYKEQANELLQKGQFSEALEYYDKAINVIKFSNIYNKIDLVKILLNRSACLIKLTQYDKTFELFEKIMNILSKQKAIADIQSNIVLSNEVKKLQFLTYVKRAYVYSINNKIDDAIKDYENALLLKPEDIKIKENIQKLKMFNK